MSCGGELCDITTLKKTAQVCCGSLYKHIRRFGSVSPTIKEAKNELSRKKYFCVVDLANYYYQGGMKRQDCAYLAVMHPTRGVMVLKRLLDQESLLTGLHGLLSWTWPLQKSRRRLLNLTVSYVPLPSDKLIT